MCLMCLFQLIEERKGEGIVGKRSDCQKIKKKQNN